MPAFLGFAAAAFWMLMIFDCVQNERDRMWIWLLIFLNIPGSVIYFVVRFLPRQQFHSPGIVKAWMMGDKLRNAEAATRNIGNAHQFLVYGDLLRTVGKYDQAMQAYTQAIERDSKSLYLHWGVATIATYRKDYDCAKFHLEKIVQSDRDFKYGSASLLYGETLFALEEWGLAKKQLLEDYQYWSHPEAALLLSQIQIRDRETDAARENLESMIAKVNASPRYHFQRHVGTLRRAKKLLKSLNS